MPSVPCPGCDAVLSIPDEAARAVKFLPKARDGRLPPLTSALTADPNSWLRPLPRTPDSILPRQGSPDLELGKRR